MSVLLQVKVGLKPTVASNLDSSGVLSLAFSLDDDLVTSGILASGALKHDLEKFLLGRFLDFEDVLSILALGAHNPDLELAIRGVHGG